MSRKRETGQRDGGSGDFNAPYRHRNCYIPRNVRKNVSARSSKLAFRRVSLNTVAKLFQPESGRFTSGGRMRIARILRAKGKPRARARARALNRARSESPFFVLPQRARDPCTRQTWNLSQGSSTRIRYTSVVFTGIVRLFECRIADGVETCQFAADKNSPFLPRPKDFTVAIVT